MARSFWDRHQNIPFSYPKSRLEKLGDLIVRPLLGSTDFAFRNIKNPLFITSMVIIGIAATSIAFYPAHVVAVIGTIMPPLLYITPGMIKFSLYMLIQTTIVGLFMRTVARLNPNGPLLTAWNAKTIVPIPIGAVLIR